MIGEFGGLSQFDFHSVSYKYGLVLNLMVYQGCEIYLNIYLALDKN